MGMSMIRAWRSVNRTSLFIIAAAMGVRSPYSPRIAVSGSTAVARRAGR
ncbi:MAG: hypothetical protein QOJ16_1481 [Acidobacteriota bacterium]|jgi:hypothetical protein|nr:hypothetical protein [Acidobacteriota bacterium]